MLDGHGGDERSDQMALWRKVWEVVSAQPAGPLHRLAFQMAGEDVVVLYSSGDEMDPADVLADIQALQRAVSGKVRVTLSAGISDLCTEPGMLPRAYEQANCSAKQTAFAGREAIYFFSQMRLDQPADMPYFDTGWKRPSWPRAMRSCGPRSTGCCCPWPPAAWSTAM